MENIEQENSSQEQSVRVAQLVPPKEALERMKTGTGFFKINPTFLRRKITISLTREI